MKWERKTKQHRKSIVIPPEMWDELGKIAKRKSVSKSDIVRRLIRNYVRGNHNQPGYDPITDSLTN